MVIAIIGGSGFYDLASGEKFHVDTPFGRSGELVETQIGGKRVLFMARHGSGHTAAPHKINYRANIYALYEEKVQYIIGTNAVGSTTKAMKPGDFVVPDQLLDFTRKRPISFFVGDSDDKLPEEFRKVVHTDVTYPYRGEVRRQLLMQIKDYEHHNFGTYVCYDGPRYETAAEVAMAKQLGGHLLGMTSAPETFLARELGIDYATICVVTNYGAGIQEKVSHDEVVELFDDRISVLKHIVTRTIEELGILIEKKKGGM